MNLEDPPEKHHVLAKEHLPALLAGRMRAEETLIPQFPTSWTVYAHRRCHRYERTTADLQDAASAATARLKLVQSPPFRPENENELRRVEADARIAHDSGLYGVSVFLKEVVRASLLQVGEAEASLRMLEFGLASLAGVRSACPIDLEKFAGGVSQDRPLAVLHAANHCSNVGLNEEARALLDHSRRLLEGPAHGQKDELALDVMLRTAQIERNPAAAREALGEATTRYAAYRVDTARVISAMIGLSEGTSVAAECFEALISDERHLSWLYRAESWFGRAVLDLQQGKVREAYRLLVASQYVYILLGLQGTPHPAMPVPAANRSDCVPADVLRDPRFDSVRKEERAELRRLAIIESSLRRDLALHLATGVPPRLYPDPLGPSLNEAAV